MTIKVKMKKIISELNLDDGISESLCSNALFRLSLFFLFNNLLRRQHCEQLKHFPTAPDVAKSDFAIFLKINPFH